MKCTENISVSIRPFPYIIGVNKSVENGTQLEGYDGKYLQVVLDALGCPYDIVVPEDMHWGVQKPDGDWTGVIGMVHRKEADLGFSYLAVMEERFKDISFTNSYTRQEFLFVSHIGEDLSKTFSFVHPFDMATWILLLVTLMVVSAIFKIFLSSSVLNTFYQVFGNLLGQSIDFKDDAMRFSALFWIWCLFACIISWSYSAILLSFLIQPMKEVPIRTFYDLSEAVLTGSHKVIFNNYSVTMLRTSNEAYMVRLGEVVESKGWIDNFINLSADLHVGRDLSRGMTTGLAKLVYGTRDDVHFSEDYLSTSAVAFAYSKNFCCLPKLNWIISQLDGAGLYEQFLLESSVKKALKSVRTSNYVQVGSPLSINDLSGALALLLIGLQQRSLLVPNASTWKTLP
ncbi:uncharacterized protein CDAR_399781 [Caerostris darwini]|uniref:Ionotropic glutamate receptor L-glutamate and glycine-binding domain-containing protein n=1 Tax=Caerostris darwini TaxID=1538125 RepID=A0AAV4SA70_9ARAC|nr:uncharacterized protein CDAR_399781 [Caerostris darwini]